MMQILLIIIFIAMAGNIIPAIATTNAVIAGLIVMEALKILDGQFNKCKTVSTSSIRLLVLLLLLLLFRPIFPKIQILGKDSS